MRRSVQRPLLQAAIDNVLAATLATATTAKRRRCSKIDLAKAEEERVQYEKYLEQAVEAEARLHAYFLPQNEDEWREFISIGIKPAIEYFFKN